MDLTGSIIILLLFIFSTGLSVGVEGEATVDHIDKNQVWGSSSLKSIRPLRSRLGLGTPQSSLIDITHRCNCGEKELYNAEETKITMAAEVYENFRS